jgi:hypothetical protein
VYVGGGRWFLLSLFFFNFLLDIFFIYISNAIPKVPYALPPGGDSVILEVLFLLELC